MKPRNKRNLRRWVSRVTRRASAACSQAGVALLEFAIVAVLLFTILFGTMVFGIGIWYYNVVAAAAKDGARWAAVRGSTATTPATATSVESYVDADVYGLTVTVTTTWPDSGSPSNGPGKRVRVKVATTFNPSIPLVLNTPLTLQSQAEMIILR